MSTWPTTWTAAVGAEVARTRKAQGMSAQRLSDRTANLGHPIQRAVLSNIENGRRPSISVHELVVIATALGVPPAALLFPAATDPHRAADPIDYLPGVHATPADAWGRFHGATTRHSARVSRARDLIAEAAAILEEATDGGDNSR